MEMEALPAEAAAPELEEASKLTHRQLLIWAEHKLAPAVPANNMVMTFEIRGALSPERFESAFRAVVDGSDALRLVVEEKDGAPRQRVLEAVDFEIPVVDLCKEEDPALASRHWIAARGARPFDLAGRLFDTALIQLRPERWLWYLCQHHIITDATSFSLIYQRTAQAYAAPSAARRVWPSFLDYLAFEEGYRGSNRARIAAEHWSQKLARPVEPLDLYGRSLPAPTAVLQRVSRDLGVERSRALQAIARDEVRAATPDLSGFVVFVALLAAYLHRVSGSSLVSIGTPYQNRRSKPFRDTAGIFMEVCVLRIPVEAGDRFEDLLPRVKDEVYASFTQGQYSLGNPVHRRSFDVILNYQSALFPSFAGMPTRTQSATGLGGLERAGGAAEGSGRGVELLTLQVQDFDAAGRFVCDFDFPAALFDRGSQQRAVGHFAAILEAFLFSRGTAIGEVDVLAPAERESLLAPLRALAPPPAGGIHGRFEIQAARTPDRTALRCGPEALSFAEVDARANQLARHLARRGVEAGDVVGLCAQRSLATAPALLGILKAGAAFLPLDPSYPEERLRWMLADARAAALVTEGDLGERLAVPQLAVVRLDTEAAAIAAEDPSLCEVALAGDAIAHLVYTSGSTGQPKGVLGPHRAALNRFEWMWDAYPFAPGEVACQKTALSFVDSVWEIFGPLLRGVPSAVVRDADARDARRLVEVLAAGGVTRIVLVPSLLQAVVEAFPDLGRRLPRLTLWFTSGEVLPATLAAAFYRAAPEARLVNLYGSTEVAGDVTCYEVPARSRLERIPIGRPIRNTAALILDAGGRLAPQGVTGELFVAGANLAAGYHDRPELTAARFGPARDAGVRVFRTGDRCRWRSDGELELVGRVDDQLKIRGYRIEPGEVEAALLRHPAVRRAAVVACEVEPGDRRLVAFLEADPPVEPAELRGRLRGELPPQMIPSHFRFLPQLPLTPNGKTNRRELERLGIEAGVASGSPARPAPEPDREKWFHRYRWVPRELPGTEESTAGTWLVFVDETGIGDALVDRLGGGARVVTVRSADSYVRRDAGRYVLNPEAGPAGYQALVRDLAGDGLLPDRIVHLWLATSGERFRPGSSFLHRNLEHGPQSLEALADALANHPLRVALWAVTNGAASVHGERIERPEKAMALGACEQVRREHPHWRVASVDLEGTGAGAAALLERELRAGPSDATAALRGGRRFERELERFAPAAAGTAASLLGAPRGGEVWITGGLGPTGMLAARALARPGVRLVLIDPADASARAADLAALRASGADVRIVAADPGDLRAMRELARARPAGVVHAAEAKLRGALVLDELFRTDPLGFLAFVSSDVFERGSAELAFLEAYACAGRQPATSIALADVAAADGDAEVLARVLGRSLEPQVLLCGADPAAARAFAWAAARAARAPRNELESSLLEVWRETLRVPELGVRDDFFDSGGDSLLAVRLLARMGALYGVDWPISVLFEAPSVEACAERIERAREEATSETGARTPTRHLVPLHGPRAGPGRPLFVASGAFGNVLNLRHIGLRMAEDRPVYGLEAPGLHPGEPPRESIEETAHDFLAEIREVQPEGPYLLAGFCSGGVVAFEMAQQLARAGEEVEVLFLLDSFLPMRDRLDWRDGLRIGLDNLRRRGPAHLIDWLRTRRRWEAEQRERRLAREREPSPGEYRSELVFEKTNEALLRYQPRPWTRPITLFRPPLDAVHELGPGRVVNAEREWVRHDNGWSPFAPLLEIHELPAPPGDHDGFVLEPQVGTLVGELRRRLRA
jgi:amino acid adenylation domain-containing protein